MTRLRISTLMLLIVIACMASAPLVQHKRANQREADLRAVFDQNRKFSVQSERFFAEKQQLLRDLSLLPAGLLDILQATD